MPRPELVRQASHVNADALTGLLIRLETNAQRAPDPRLRLMCYRVGFKSSARNAITVHG